MAKESNIAAQQAVLSSDPSAPASGRSVIYPKSDGEWYVRNADGAIKPVTSGGYTVLSKTFSDSPYTITQTSGEVILLINATGGNVVVNLPSAVDNAAIYNIKKTDSSANTVTIDANGSQTIDNGLTAVLRVQYASVMLVSDNANMLVV